MTSVAASVDAISYLGLHEVFPANMTGNTVLLAVGLAKEDYPSTIRSATALAGFVVGALVAGYVSRGRGWNNRVAALLGGELAVLLAAAGWWISLDGPPPAGPRYGLIALLGVAMGAQSGTITSLGVGVSTTYITGTWTSVSRRLGRRLRGSDRHEVGDAQDSTPRVQRAVLAVYVLAAIAGGYLFLFRGAVAVWLPVVALGTACLAACVTARVTAVSDSRPRQGVPATVALRRWPGDD